MSGLKKLVLEVHRRSLWQVLAIYGAASWIVYEAIEALTSGLGLPEWFPALAVILLLIGLPIVLATAFIQEGGPTIRRSDPTLLLGHESTIAGPEVGPATRDLGGVRKLFTWRNAILGGVLALALWGVVAAGWLMLGFPGLLLKAEAADFFNERDRVIVAEFENETDQPALALAIREAVITDLDQSPYVNVVGRALLRGVLGRMRLPDTTHVDVDIAVEIARREGHPAVVAGSVARLGTGYQLSARIVEAATGEVAVRLRATAANDGEVVAAVEQLTRLVRGHLGESLASVRRSTPLPGVTTASLEALELYARGLDYSDSGDQSSAIPLLQQAVRLDTAFAMAHRALGIYFGNSGNPSAAQNHIDRAYRFGERLVERERFLVGAGYHTFRNRFDSAAYYYELILDRDPDMSTAVNNLGDLYERMGRYEDALQLYRRTVEIAPDIAVGYINLASAARTLDQPELADSVLDVMRVQFSGSPYTGYVGAGNAYFADDLAGLDSVARELATHPSRVTSAWGLLLLAYAPAMRGEIGRAIALADSAAQRAAETGATLIIYLSLWSREHVAFAAGMPERARPYRQAVRLRATEEDAPFFRHLALGFIAFGSALTGDLEESRDILAAMDSLAQAADFRPAGIAHAVRAAIALQEDRAEESVDHLRRARAADYGVLFRPYQLLLGDAYAALGRLAEAAAQYDTLTSTYRLDFRDYGVHAALRPLAHERLGSIYLALGDTTSAVEHLSAFAELWQHADPELQPRVESARRLVAQLAGEKS